MTHSWYHACPAPSEHFTGYTKVVTQLDTSLLDGLQRQHIHVLSGRSGVGKTQAALQYAKTRKKFFSDIIFVDASTPETIKRSYVSFITSKNRGSTLADSFQWLASSRNNRADWLIIFDGANTVDLEIRGLLPSCAHGNVIVTTRRNNLPSHSEWPRTESRMSGLNHEDAVALLVKVAGGETFSCSQNKLTLDRIAQEMHCLPFPLTLAGVYLRRGSCSLSESGRLYCESVEALSAAMGPEEHPSKSRSISQLASSVVLRGLSTHATHILGVMAFMEYQNLSEIIFQRAAVRLPHYTATLPPTDTEATVEEFLSQLLIPLLTEHGSWNVSAFHSLMSELLEYHLLHYNERSISFNMSPICRNSILAAQDLDREFLCRVATHLLAVSVDSSMNTDCQERVFRQTVAPHVDCALLQGENISLDDAVRFALVYAENDQLDEAEVLQLEVVEFRRQILGENHPLTLESMEQLAIINKKQGKWREDDDDSSLSEQDSFSAHISYELRRERQQQPRVTRNRISISLHRITAATPLDVVVKYFTLVSRLHDLTSELKPHSAAMASSGGQGNVYQAVLMDNTSVAIKSIRHDWAKLENKVTKYAAREIATWTKLVHPNILELLGLAIFQEQLVMVSPWMPCGNVVEFARQHNGNRGSLCLQLSSAVAYMHSLNVIHGDIKGSNVLVSEDGVVKLADFGLTIIQNATLDISITNRGGGTVRWMAPELLMEDSAVRSEAADMYALGMTFLEIYTGHRPYKDTRHDIAVMAMIARRESIKRPEELSPHVTYGNHVWDILQQCWKWNPKERPTASQIKALLYEIV